MALLYPMNMFTPIINHIPGPIQQFLGLINIKLVDSKIEGFIYH